MKTYIRYGCILLLTVILVSCRDSGVQPKENLSQSTGSVLFSLSKATTPSDVSWIVAKLEHTSYPTIIDSVSVAETGENAQLRIQYIQQGMWSLTVTAKDSGGVERYRGEAAVEIHSGQVTVANITLNSSFGELEINITWPTSDGEWKTNAHNPVLEQTPGGFDSDYFFFHDPKVLKISGTYRMWYTSGYNLFVQEGDLNWIMYATSTDGITWTKHGPVLQPGPTGSWYEKGAVLPAVLYDEGIYKMWFVGNSAAEFGAGIGYAESNDGTAWNINPGLVVVSDDSKPELRYPEVVKKEGLYYLFYNAGALAAGSLEIYLMTSTDGQQWVDRGKVLSKRSNVSWETRGVSAPGILVEQNKFKMYYTGLGPFDESIGYAESADGIHWLNRSTEPVLVPSQASPWSITYASHPTLLRDGDKLKMWFSGLSQSPYHWEIGYAEQQ